MKRRIYLSGGISGVERADYVRRFREAEATEILIRTSDEELEAIES